MQPSNQRVPGRFDQLKPPAARFPPPPNHYGSLRERDGDRQPDGRFTVLNRAAPPKYSSVHQAPPRAAEVPQRGPVVPPTPWVPRGRGRGGYHQPPPPPPMKDVTSPFPEEVQKACTLCNAFPSFTVLPPTFFDQLVLPVLKIPLHGQLFGGPEAELLKLLARIMEEIDSKLISPEFRSAIVLWPPLARLMSKPNNESVESLHAIAEGLSKCLEFDKLNPGLLTALHAFARNHLSAEDRLHAEITDAYHRANPTPAVNAAVVRNTVKASSRKKVSVYPSPEELLEDPFTVRRRLPSLSAEPIEDLEQHIDNVFALTREDFLLPLRDGVLAALNVVQGVRFETQKEWDIQRQRQLQAYIYDNVTFRGHGVTTQEGVVFGFQAHQPAHRRQPIKFASRFMQGNLVIITKYAGRETPIGRASVLGVVVRRRKSFEGPIVHDPIDDGVFDVSFTDASEERYDIASLMNFFVTGERYHIVESKAFFVPIHRVLSQLKVFDAAQLDSLASALRVGEVDAFHVTKAVTVAGVVHTKPDLHETTLRIDQSFDEIRIDARNLFSDWSEALEGELTSNPTLHVVDDTQRDAIALAFSSNLPIIQGTPGTGKTFIGGKIVQLLLKNNIVKSSEPMLIIAHTQHALDSFTLDLLEIEDPANMVRIGRPSLNPKIKDANLGFDFKLKNSYRRPPPTAEGDLHRLAVKRNAMLVADCIMDEDLIEIDAFDRLPYEWKHFLTDERRRWVEMKSQIQERVATLKAQIELIEARFADVPIDSIPEQETSDAHSMAHLQRREVELTTEIRRLHAVHFSGGMELLWTQFVRQLNGLRKTALQHCQRQLTNVNSALKIKNAVAAYKASQPQYLQALNEWDDLQDRLKRFENGWIRYWRSELGEYRQPARPLELEPVPAAPVIPIPRREGDAVLCVEMPEDEVSDAGDFEDYQAQLNAEDRRVLDDVAGAENTRREEIDLELGNSAAVTAQRWFKNNPPEGGAADSAEKRHIIVQHLQALVQGILRDRMQALVALIDTERRLQMREEDDAKVRMLRQHRIITATTTGAALVLPLLHRCNIGIVMIEEAAEVPESHVLACLPRSTKQLILIGDPRQLPPKVNDMALGKKHGLDMSLMDRLQKLGVRHVTLTTQRRMHPDISDFVKPYYLQTEKQEIKDHPSTLKRELVGGLSDSVEHYCWIDSKESCEEVSPGTQSSFNAFESELAICVAEYLAFHVKRETIVIITPYKGQLLKLMEDCRKAHVPWTGRTEQGKIRLVTIDDYQGEECDAVILTLVRTEQPGFLTKDNRACVALSRAKRFLCVIGSSSVIERASPIWSDALHRCKYMEVFFEKFPAFCVHHGKDLSFACREEYRALVNANGGCMTPCAEKLHCGHSCPLDCHVEAEATHASVQCKAPCRLVGALCNPPRQCEHPCTKLCGEKCAACHEKIPVVLLACGEHCAEAECYQRFQGPLPKCKAKVTRELDCGHELEAPCHEWSRDGSAVSEKLQRQCKQPCLAQMPCGHRCQRTCHMDDPNHAQGVKKCNATRQSLLPCGHGTVPHRCCQDIPPCNQPCAAMRDCGHPCQSVCHAGPCERKLCTLEVDFVHPVCRHAGKKACGSDSVSAACNAPCGAKLVCDHSCQAKCSDCRKNSTAGWAACFAHPPCTHQGTTTLPCGHDCQRGCGGADLPCTASCTRQCPHFRCDGRHKDRHPCGECPAVACRKACAWCCPHHQCTKTCSEECDREPCFERCTKTLPCGHLCQGCCGEKCPDVCLVCAGKEGTIPPKLRHISTLFDDDASLLMYCREGTLPEALAADPQFEPWQLQVIQLECLCMWFREEITHHVAQRSNSSGLVQVVSCPNCRAPILPGAVLMFHAMLIKNQQSVHAVRKLRREATRDLQQQYEDEAQNVASLVIDLLGEVNIPFESVEAQLNVALPPPPVPPCGVQHQNQKTPKLFKDRRRGKPLQDAERFEKFKRDQACWKDQLETIHCERRQCIEKCTYHRDAAVLQAFLKTAEDLQWKLLLGANSQTQVTVAPAQLIQLIALVKEWQHCHKLLHATRRANARLTNTLSGLSDKFDELIQQQADLNVEQLKFLSQRVRRIGMLARCEALGPAASRLLQAIPGQALPDTSVDAQKDAATRAIQVLLDGVVFPQAADMVR